MADTTTGLGLTSTVTGQKNVASTRTTTMMLFNARTGVHRNSQTVTTALNVAKANATSSVRHNVNTTLELSLDNFVFHFEAGGRLSPPPEFELVSPQYIPPSGRGLRFIVQDTVSGEFKDWDLPLTNVELTYTLSGPTLLKARLGPEYPEAREYQLDAWSTWIHVEQDGLIRASVIVQPLAVDGEDLIIDGIGVTGYPAGIPYMSQLQEILIDPAEIIRRIWSHLQTYPDGNMGVTVSNTATPLRLGDPERWEFDIDADGVQKVKDVPGKPTLDGQGQPEDMKSVIEDDTLVMVKQNEAFSGTWAGLQQLGYTAKTYQNIQVMYPKVGDLYRAKVFGKQYATQTLPVVKYVAAKPYELVWWDEKDCGSEIDSLAAAAPIDYVEVCTWNAGRTLVDHHVQLGFPRLGTRRFDLRFVEDENLMEAVFARETPDQYASQVIVRGSGEGRDSIRGYAGGRNPRRLRRVVAVTDQTVTNATQANAVARAELTRRLAVTSVESITVDANHPNAPIGSFAVGDDILIQAQIPYIGTLKLWHRITSITWAPDDGFAKLAVRRSDQFNYGPNATAAESEI